MARKRHSDIKQIAKLLQTTVGGGRGRRSPLFRWMFARADDLKRVLDDIQPSWNSLAAVLPLIAAVNDGSGKRPNGERVRKTWYEVRRAKGWGVAKVPRPKPTRQSQPSPQRPLAQPAPRVLIQPAPPIPTQPGARDGGLQEVLKAMDAKHGQMPKPFK